MTTPSPNACTMPSAYWAFAYSCAGAFRNQYTAVRGFRGSTSPETCKSSRRNCTQACPVSAAFPKLRQHPMLDIRNVDRILQGLKAEWRRSRTVVQHGMHTRPRTKQVHQCKRTSLYPSEHGKVMPQSWEGQNPPAGIAVRHVPGRGTRVRRSAFSCR